MRGHSSPASIPRRESGTLPDTKTLISSPRSWTERAMSACDVPLGYFEERGLPPNGDRISGTARMTPIRLSFVATDPSLNASTRAGVGISRWSALLSRLATMLPIRAMMRVPRTVPKCCSTPCRPSTISMVPVVRSRVAAAWTRSVGAIGTRAGAATALTRRCSTDCAVWPHDSRTLNVPLNAIALYSD
jgi:hypothetical protein